MVTVREATIGDVPAIETCRAGDEVAGPADPRIARYLAGEHHPQQALAPRVLFVATADGPDGERVLGYTAGHLTRRFDLEGELQYLYVGLEHRRQGIAAALFRALRDWFVEHDAREVCANVSTDNDTARAFCLAHGANEMGPYWVSWADVGAAG